MPADVAIVIAAIVTAFLIFGAALAWTQIQTRQLNK